MPLSVNGGVVRYDAIAEWRVLMAVGVGLVGGRCYRLVDSGHRAGSGGCRLYSSGLVCHAPIPVGYHLAVAARHQKLNGTNFSSILHVVRKKERNVVYMFV
jgi:hypothetical protein